MTLGGLALAVGILVDDATVTIENINWHPTGGDVVNAILGDGGKQIVTPAFVLPSVDLYRIRADVLPRRCRRASSALMAEAVVFAALDRLFSCRAIVGADDAGAVPAQTTRRSASGHAESGRRCDARRCQPALRPKVISLPARFQRGFEGRFEGVRDVYRALLTAALQNRRAFLLGFLVVAAFVRTGAVARRKFFLHRCRPDHGMRAQTGTRIEETARRATEVEKTIRRLIPPSNPDAASTSACRSAVIDYLQQLAR